MANKKYVLGIVTGSKHILLIGKLQPEWQAGKYNFLGGKIEEGETADEAISREIKEECGLHFNVNEFTYNGLLYRPNDFEMYIYSIDCGDAIFDAKTLEEEKIHIIPINTFMEMPSVLQIENLKWLYTMINDGFKKEFNVEYL